MKDKNIYSGQGLIPRFVRCIDRLLANSDQYITNDMVLKEENLFKDLSRRRNYQNELKKAVNAIKVYMQEKHNLSWDYAVGNNVKYGYRYPEENRDPLIELRENQTSLCKEQLLQFIQDSANFLPKEWLNYFMQGTQLLLEEDKKTQDGSEVMQTESSRLLKNKELIPTLYNAIVKQQPLQIRYWASYEEEQDIIFHPHFLKEYNGRWFLFGFADYSDGTTRDKCNLAVDRLVTTPLVRHDISFVAKTIASYSHYFDDIVGVTHIDGEELRVIKIRTMDKYTHFSLKTKPLHISQKEISPFQSQNGFGEFEIQVRKNPELSSLLLSFGNRITFEEIN